MPDVRYRIWDRGAAGSAISRERTCLERGREERVRRVKNFFRVSPSARYLEAIFGSARGSPSGNVMAARDERIPPTNIKTCLFLSWGWSNICAECRSSRAVSLCGSRVGSLPSGRLREGMPSPWRVEAETGRRRPEMDSTGSEDVRRTEKAKEGLKVWRARESHGT